MPRAIEHLPMTLAVGDHVHKVADPSVRGNIQQIGDGRLSVDVAGEIIDGSVDEWKEVPDVEVTDGDAEDAIYVYFRI